MDVPRTLLATSLVLGVAAVAGSLSPAHASKPVPRLSVSVMSMAADGARLAFVTPAARRVCEHVAIWTPATASVRRLWDGRMPCDPSTNGPIALAGKVAAWLWRTTTGTYEERAIVVATYANPKGPKPFLLHSATDRGSGVGTVVGRPAGDGALISFTAAETCDADAAPGAPERCPPGLRTGDTVATTLYRTGGPGPCSGDARKDACTPIARADGPLTVLAVDAGRIADATPTSVTLLSHAGVRLRELPVAAHAAAMSGKRLALRTDNAIEIYETGSGRQVARFPVPNGVRLEDLEGELLVTASGGTVTVQKLPSGRSVRFRPGGTARAQLERPGLFIAGAHRLTFTPMRELLQRLEA
jgi:hypothetical protein